MTQLKGSFRPSASIPSERGAASAAHAAAVAELKAHWHDFCDCDPFPTYEGFAERMEAAGLVAWRSVESDDLDAPFAAERGIEPGGTIFVLTDAGRAAIQSATGEE